jgi:hypothetical protein
VAGGIEGGERRGEEVVSAGPVVGESPLEYVMTSIITSLLVWLHPTSRDPRRRSSWRIKRSPLFVADDGE